MNFQKLTPVPQKKELLDLAFRKARLKGVQKKFVGNWLQKIRYKENLKLDIVKDTLVTRLMKVLQEFPNTMDLNDFYVELIKLTLDYVELKKSFGALDWAIKQIGKVHRVHIVKVNEEKEGAKVKKITLQYYGRIASILKQINPQLKYLEQSRKTLRKFPAIKELFTVCLYGFPNVGKTTILNKLTGTKAKVAAYSFTTKSINAGYMKLNDTKVQVLDVPGTLARKDKMNDIELQAELVLNEVANVVVYIFDLSGASGYSIKNQEQLLQNLGKKRKVFPFVNKQDITDESLLKEFTVKHYTLEEIKAEVEKLM
ncbi:GTP-binding protein [Candidatus Woesearchaeota archaeon]|jgi:nucleolar GTP-binding protein|nr:GTP-binding protein [Candidatus Woesearchaeota archaeon]MBT4151040.1 GTP-binding protein [Candidatus Woesearchaeota archaeon]MBT4247582.1 GTP-binding protein [Candidatus Woesearchaeota archaeon]MBT4433830.1 GTP-binding protein [Candidatus Woesearchaeota archaeon]MBT7332171.1 GTP-binding protein [Candidatus Woesearchaeota archaeon]